MKLSYLILVICVFTTSCKKSDEQLMKDKIEENYTSKANEALFEDYEPVSFSEVDTIFSRIEADNEYIGLTNLANKISLKINEIVFERNGNLIGKKKANHQLLLLYDRLDKVNKQRETVKRTFKKQVVGFRMKHTFHIKNKVTGKKYSAHNSGSFLRQFTH